MIVPRKLADEGSSARNFAVRGLTGSLILNAASQRVLALEQRHSRSANLRNDGRACTINRVSSWILSRSYRPVRDGRDVSSHETLRAGDQEDRRQSAKVPRKPPRASGKRPGGKPRSASTWRRRLGLAMLRWSLVVVIWCAIAMGAVFGYFALTLPETGDLPLSADFSSTGASPA